MEDAISKGEFREDLYYRLNVVSIGIPPLRERKEDLPELASYFLGKSNREMGKKVAGLTPEAMEKITAYEWPGNVRQLENILKRALVLCQGEWILEDHLLFGKGLEKREPDEALEKKSFEEMLDTLFEELFKTPLLMQDLDMISAVEKGLILRALQKTKGNQVQAALLLGINRSTLRSKMEKYHITKDVLVSEKKE